MMKALHSLMAVVVPATAVYMVLLLGVYLFQRSLIYHPPPASMSETERTKLGLEELSAHTEDGLELKGRYAPPTSKPFTLVHFHGNGDDIATAAWIAKPYIDRGYGFLLVEYRGYSGLPGRPSEEGLYRDGRAFIRALVTTGIEQRSLVLFGYSLGSGVATQMATEFDVAGLILLAPFLSLPKAAHAHFPIFPTEPLTLDRFENFKKVGTLHTPLLIANGADDRVIPAAQGRELFQTANPPKEGYFSPLGGHLDMFDQGFGGVSLDWLAHLPSRRARPETKN